MTKKSNLLICKSEACLSCWHKVEASTDGDELEVICQLELDGADEGDGEECTHYTTTVPKEESSGNKIEEGKQGKSRKVWGSEEGDISTSRKGEVMTTKKVKVVFVGDQLVETKQKAGDGVMTLAGNFVDAWNLKIREAEEALKEASDEIKADAKKQVETIESSHQAFIEEVKSKVLSGEFDPESPASLFEEKDLDLDDLGFEDEDDEDEDLEDDFEEDDDDLDDDED